MSRARARRSKRESRNSQGSNPNSEDSVSNNNVEANESVEEIPKAVIPSNEEVKGMPDRTSRQSAISNAEEKGDVVPVEVDELIKHRPPADVPEERRLSHRSSVKSGNSRRLSFQSGNSGRSANSEKSKPSSEGEKNSMGTPPTDEQLIEVQPAELEEMKEGKRGSRSSRSHTPRQGSRTSEGSSRMKRSTVSFDTDPDKGEKTTNRASMVTSMPPTDKKSRCRCAIQ